MKFNIGDEIKIISQPLHRRLTLDAIYTIIDEKERSYPTKIIVPVVIGDDGYRCILYVTKYKNYKEIIFNEQMKEIINEN